MNTASKENYESATYEKYLEIYKYERDSMLFQYFKNSEGEKKRAIAYLLYQRGYKNFGYK